MLSSIKYHSTLISTGVELKGVSLTDICDWYPLASALSRLRVVFTLDGMRSSITNFEQFLSSVENVRTLSDKVCFQDVLGILVRPPGHHNHMCFVNTTQSLICFSYDRHCFKRLFIRFLVFCSCALSTLEQQFGKGTHMGAMLRCPQTVGHFV